MRRREFMRGASVIAAARALGVPGSTLAAEPPPETTKIALARDPTICPAPMYVAEELLKFATWQRSRGAVPTVVALRQRFDAIRRAELQRLDNKLGGLSPEARARVDEVTRLIVEKLLLDPTEQLKALPDEETQVAYTEAVNRLFRLRTGESSSSSTDAAADPSRTDQQK